MAAPVSLLSRLARKWFRKDRSTPPPRPVPDLLTDIIYDADDEAGAIAQIKEALARSASVSAAAKDGDTALHQVCALGFAEAARVLLDAGADVSARGRDDMTPFVAAGSAVNPALLQLLLDRGADPAAKDRTGGDALDRQIHWVHFPTREKPDFVLRDTACLALLLGRGLALKNSWDRSVIYNERPQLAALLPDMVAVQAFDRIVKEQDLAALQAALDEGTAPDVVADYGGQAALCFAAEKNNLPMMEMLMKAGAHINRESAYKTPLQAAVLAGAREAFVLLMNAGADTEALYTADRYPDTTLPELADMCKKDSRMRLFVEDALAHKSPDIVPFTEPPPKPPDVTLHHAITLDKPLRFRPKPAAPKPQAA